MADLPEPCPDRILFHTGCLFAIGAVGGTAFHFPKGLYNSPSGARFIGGAQAVRMNAPRVAGRFGLWGGLYSTLNCALAYARQKEDLWNPMLAGTAASGLVSMRKGFGPMARAAMGCAALFAFMDGMAITFERFMSPQARMQQVTFEEVPQVEDKALQAAPRSWFSRLFGQKDQPRKF
ncbi:hypothetical protein Tco_1391030 [Tanacetum coccineum]